MAELDVAAMDAGDVTGNCEPKPGRAGILVARMVEPVEWTEHLFALGLRDAGTVVLDRDGQRAFVGAAP